MSKGKKQYYFVKQKENELIRFRYGDQQDIYYQIFSQQHWSEKKCVYKGCFEYFYILNDWKGGVHVLCQDICGDIILCTIDEKDKEKWTITNLIHLNIIMPRYIRGFIDKDNIHLFYNIVDEYSYEEVLVHQIMEGGIKWNSPKVISSVENFYQFPYKISQDCNGNIVLVNTRLSEVHQLTSRTFYTTEGKWGMEEIVHTSISPYKDYTLCIEENRNHYLFITQDEQTDRLIYQYTKVGSQEEKILYCHNKIDSCLFVLTNEELLVLWVCENKVYGSNSTDHGLNFSNPRIVEQFDGTPPVKGFYLQYKECFTLPYEVYVINQNEEDHIYLHGGIIECHVVEVEEEGSLLECEEHEEMDKLQLMNNEELETKFASVDQELRRLNEQIKVEQNEGLKLKNQLYKEKEINKLSTSYNNRLKEKNSYLEYVILQKDKDIMLFEKQLAEKIKVNQELQHQLSQVEMKNKKLTNEDGGYKKKINDDSKQRILSLERWSFEEENK